MNASGFPGLEGHAQQLSKTWLRLLMNSSVRALTSGVVYFRTLDYLSDVVEDTLILLLPDLPASQLLPEYAMIFVNFLGE